MDNIKLTIEQKNIINDIVKNNFNPQKKIEEVLANKKRLLGVILEENSKINILLDKKNILEEFFEKYSSLKKAKEDEYNKILLEIKDIAGKIEIAEKPFYIKKDNNSEGKVVQIKKNITDIGLLKNNRKLYSEKFLAIKLKTIENIKKLLLERVITQKAYEELENEVINMKTFGIEFTELEKGQILETIKEKYKDDKNIIDLVRQKEEWRKLKKAQEDIQKKIKIKTEKTIQIPIDYTNNSQKIIEKSKEILPNGHINEIFGEGFYERLTKLGKLSSGNIQEIQKVYNISKNGFNNNNLKEETDFIVNFLTRDRRGNEKYIFMYEDRDNLIKKDLDNEKKVRELAKMHLKSHNKINNILVLLESLNIQKNFKEIINANKKDILDKEINKYCSVINNIKLKINNTDNDEFLEIISSEIDNISQIYNNISNILIDSKDENSNNFHKILKKIGEYMAIWYAIGIYTKKKDEYINSVEYELEQLIFHQLIQYESRDLLDMNLDLVSDSWLYVDYIKGLVTEDTERENEQFLDVNFLKNIYNSIDSIMGIYVNQLTINSKKKSILQKDKLKINDNEEMMIDEYKNLGNKYYNSFPKISEILENAINIGESNDIKEQEQLLPMVIKSNDVNKLIMGIGTKKEIEAIYGKKIRTIKRDNKDISEKEINEVIKEDFYRETDVMNHKLIIPITQLGIVTIYLHNNGDISTDGMTAYSLIDILGDLDYERIRAWLFYYIYSANLENTELGNPTEELGLNKKIEKIINIPKENKAKIVTTPIKKVEDIKTTPGEVLELSGYINDYLKEKGNKDDKLILGIQRIAYKSFQQRSFDFERYEKEYKINKNDENRIEIKKRANDNGREGSYVELKTKENEIEEEEERIDEEEIHTDESDNTTNIQSMPENIEGRIKFLEANNMYIYKSNKEKIEEFLMNGSIDGKKYIGVKPESLYTSIISKNKIIKKNKHNKNRRNIRIQKKGRRVMSMVDKKFLVVDIASYNDTYEQVRYNKYKENPNYSKEDIYIPE